MQQSVPIQAMWKAQIMGRHVLLDPSGQQHGTFQRTGKTLRDGKAEVQGQPFLISQRGVGTSRTITATTTEGYDLARLDVGSTLWTGTVIGPGFGRLDVRRKLGLTSRFTFNAGPTQIVSAQRKGRSTEIFFLPDVPMRAPVLLVLGLALVQTHHRATSN
ncbi:hypothetical protein [Euzebya tangerina]|uniref:hypothetical protein n=1 Tax=Euzebya tangerina TaxID=591198 RepID=UPI000E311956|nr:hypothetical protein [Euzebya tangerina]